MPGPAPLAFELEPEFFRLIAEHSLAGIYVVGADGLLEYANPKFCEMFGYLRGELIGNLGPLELTHPDDQDDVKEKMEALLTGTIDIVRSTYRGAHKDQREMHYEVMADRVELGGQPAIIGTIMDITERVLKEQELERHHDHLELTIEERTQELATANQELNAFASSVSHDLRVPARAVLGFTRALLEDYGDRLDGQGLDYLHRIDKAGRRMEELIEDLLALSRATSGTLETRTVSLSALVQEMLQELADSAPERSASFEIQDGIAVDGDRRLLEVLFQNLTANAWKFTKTRDHTEIAFGCTVMQDGDGKGQSTCFLRDNGIGFDMASADRLFLPFERLNPAGDYEGTGLGLATVRRIVKRHRGRIWAESTPGQGATFWVQLPGLGDGLITTTESVVSAPQKF